MKKNPLPNPTHYSRRKFIGTLGAAALPLILPSRLFGAEAPSKRISLGFIGTGSHGRSVNLASFLPEVDAIVLAVCDVNDLQSKVAKDQVDKQYGNTHCVVYRDFREVLARKDIDAVVISTPDHWHVPMTLAALKAGKHVFSEKPTLTIKQGRILADAVKQSGRVFQWGIEDRSLIKYAMMVQWARNGAVGNVQRVYARIPEFGSKDPYPMEDPVPVPKGLDWNLWLGPAPFHPFTPNRFKGDRWRRIFDYSGGSMTDWGSHLVDTAQLMLGMDATGPLTVEGTGVIPENMMSNVPWKYNVNYAFANGTSMQMEAGDTLLRVEGSKGWIAIAGWEGGFSASSKELLGIRYPKDSPGYRPLPKREQRNFLDCIQSGQPTTYHPEAGHRLFTTLHLGHLAVRTGQKLKWDPDKEGLLTPVTDPGLLDRPSRDWDKA